MHCQAKLTRMDTSTVWRLAGLTRSAGRAWQRGSPREASTCTPTRPPQSAPRPAPNTVLHKHCTSDRYPDPARGLTSATVHSRGVAAKCCAGDVHLKVVCCWAGSPRKRTGCSQCITSQKTRRRAACELARSCLEPGASPTHEALAWRCAAQLACINKHLSAALLHCYEARMPR